MTKVQAGVQGQSSWETWAFGIRQGVVDNLMSSWITWLLRIVDDKIFVLVTAAWGPIMYVCLFDSSDGRMNGGQLRLGPKGGQGVGSRGLLVKKRLTCCARPATHQHPTMNTLDTILARRREDD